jgi:hypothetical protein
VDLEEAVQRAWQKQQPTILTAEALLGKRKALLIMLLQNSQSSLSDQILRHMG